jgi:hypothetical protein
VLPIAARSHSPSACHEVYTAAAHTARCRTDTLAPPDLTDSREPGLPAASSQHGRKVNPTGEGHDPGACGGLSDEPDVRRSAEPTPICGARSDLWSGVALAQARLPSLGPALPHRLICAMVSTNELRPVGEPR